MKKKVTSGAVDYLSDKTDNNSEFVKKAWHGTSFSYKAKE